MIASIGLVLDIVGVIFIFIWGPPMPEMEGSVGLALESGTVLKNGTMVADEEKKQLQRRKTHNIISRAGLGIICVGFLLQLISQWI
ncbi:MAG TPA: hypothetical protein VJ574_02410 [Candidatus Bathyarchaeia archaeon]|nr:hypothetical protein [Candidatus Bathyarchaeia archaeon]